MVAFLWWNKCYCSQSGSWTRVLTWFATKSVYNVFRHFNGKKVTHSTLQTKVLKLYSKWCEYLVSLPFSACLSVFLSDCVSLSVCLYQSVCLFANVQNFFWEMQTSCDFSAWLRFVCFSVSVSLFVCLSLWLSICLPVCLSVGPVICQLVCLFVYRW